jgi:fructose PTS system EIIBC or EIIC component
MVRVSELISPETVLIGLDRRDKRGVIEELLACAGRTGKVEDPALALRALARREAVASTALNHGVALPHARSNAVRETILVIGVSSEGVDFQSSDGKPARIFFLLLSPEAAAGPAVQLLAAIARLASDGAFREAMHSAMTPAEAFCAIETAEAARDGGSALPIGTGS